MSAQEIVSLWTLSAANTRGFTCFEKLSYPFLAELIKGLQLDCISKSIITPFTQKPKLPLPAMEALLPFFVL